MVFIPRKISSELEEHLTSQEISLILGPRQAGKTTIMLKLVENLREKDRPTAYFNLDVIEDRLHFQSQHTLLDRLEKIVGRRKAVVFIDEIQRLENAGLFLKGLFDLKTGHKFIVSGSGSLELKANIVEPMTGRKRVFFCLPLSFSEFAAFKTGVNFQNVSENLETNPFERERLINEYLTYGGYPRVVLAPTHEEKINLLKEIYQSYLEKDVQLLLGVEKETSFQTLVKILADQVGNLINRSELSNTLGLAQKTLEKYLFLLEKTFVISLVRPFFRNVRKELRKSPKVYFVDLGFLNLARRNTSLINQPVEGSLFENACFLRLAEVNPLDSLNFWRSVSGAEVDFVVNPKTGRDLIPFEVKTSLPKKGVVGKSLVSFISTYQPKHAYFYTLKQKETFKKFGVQISSLPFHLLPNL